MAPPPIHPPVTPPVIPPPGSGPPRPGVTRAPAKDRVNYIRFGPYRNIIGNDATHKMSAGKWYLLGIKD
jgi:hypothetical protein